jgi:hypothetical protein
MYEPLPATVPEVLPVEAYHLVNAIAETISTKMTSALVNATNTLSQIVDSLLPSTNDSDRSDVHFEDLEDFLDKAMAGALGGPMLYTLGLRKVIKVDISHFSSKSLPLQCIQIFPVINGSLFPSTEQNVSKINIPLIPARLIQTSQGRLIREPTATFTSLLESTVITMTEKAIETAGLEVENTWAREKRLHFERHQEQKTNTKGGTCFFWIAEEDYEWAVGADKTREMGTSEGLGVSFEWKCKLCHRQHTVQVFQ